MREAAKITLSNDDFMFLKRIARSNSEYKKILQMENEYGKLRAQLQGKEAEYHNFKNQIYKEIEDAGKRVMAKNFGLYIE